MLVAVSDEANIPKLDRYHKITARLADPRKTTQAEAEQLITPKLCRSTGLSGSIHSPETGSPEMLMELAYRLAVEDSPLIHNIRKNLHRADYAGHRSGRPRPRSGRLQLSQGESRQSPRRSWFTGANTSRTITIATAWAWRCSSAAP